ncbi:PAS domain-containing sensor histidine kinase [Loktanella sp. D2R18]|uniref:sensor histidine kinase NtrY-like n=1 Tax=Rhodobacterales TaxID=204455 RepID=UPI000DEA498C|nr:MULTISPECIES: PAS domain-containing sensor histidine kinase [Rhodobacterales]MDO6589547.1 PAS domain-containing sensor histidine kinase [Yoonia sp. 1_MG-2023]RBW44188.1 PAS domain-containing sensor histidine kinase [Loktanella sp. D2R18]
MQFSRWQRRRHVQSLVTGALVVAGPVLAILTYVVIGPLGQGASSAQLRTVLLVDLVYVLIVMAVVMRQVARMVAARRAKSAGSRLHFRLTGVFAAWALIPTVLVAVFSVLLISVALDGMFSEPVGNVLRTSLTTAQAYEAEHRQELTRDARGLAGYLNRERQANLFMDDGEVRRALGEVEAQIERSLTESFVIDGAGEIKARGANSYDFDYERPSAEEFTRADAEGLILIEDAQNNEFRALVALSAFRNRYLYVTRSVDGNVLSLLNDTTQTVEQYELLASERGKMLFQFGLLYLGFAVILILAAIWAGLWFAERLSRPIGRLVSASRRVGSGDLDVRVIEDDGDDEIAQLGRYFNQMTGQLKGQRDELLETNRMTEQRRRLFDSVLSSVTSGVIGLDAEGRVTMMNPSAQRLLSVDPNDQGPTALPVAIPEFADLFGRLRGDGVDNLQDQVNLVRKGQQESLLVRMSPRRNADGALEGYVVAFDDVTDLVSAQRMAAWGDVARRIAHEIKNPLTPIQLSAERIKRKFAKSLGDDAGKLEQMTDVIVRQTNDLRRIVDDFSKFARMPEPQLAVADLTKLVADAVTLQRAGQPDVQITAALPEAAILADMDGTMISQALMNLIKNAGEATETYMEKKNPDGYARQVHVAMTHVGDQVQIRISDNGVGLPSDRARLFEPYVTTRDKGTGLGLPIVKKIIEEHGGTLSLVDAEIFDGQDHTGACAIIHLPITPAVTQAIKIPA